jgi:hypothetical protein
MVSIEDTFKQVEFSTVRKITLIGGNFYGTW